MEQQGLIMPAMETSEGDGVTVFRLFPLPNRIMYHDPFVLWDHFSLSTGQGFPTHPHRGFEAITYMFTGSIEHKDNLGNCSTVTAGGIQCFTAGRGIQHSEMPSRHEKSSGIQLWINLEKRLKGIEPGYQQIDKEQIPRLSISGGTVRVIAGKESPLHLHTNVRYLHINLEAGASHTEKVDTHFQGLVYLLHGKLRINQQILIEKQAWFFANLDQVILQADTDCEFMLCMGQPHREPVRQYGPFVD